MIQISDRIAVVSKNDVENHICYFIGYGIYAGKSLVIYNKNLCKKGKKVSKNKIECCKFILDDGRIFYDYEVWVMSEERFKKAFIEDEYKEGWRIVKVNRKSKHLGI